MSFLEFWKFIFSNGWIFTGSFVLIVTVVAIIVGGLVAILQPIQGKHVHHHYHGVKKQEALGNDKEKPEEKGWDVQ